jgi:methionyl-tRNA formyltransferase
MYIDLSAMSMFIRGFNPSPGAWISTAMSAIFLLAAQHLEDSPDMVGEFWTNGIVYDCLMLSCYTVMIIYYKVISSSEVG